jgi:DNA replication protein DnaC
VEFFMEGKQSYRKDSDETEMGVLKRYRTPDLLVIDEIGKRGETTWEDTLLFELIDMRYRDMSDTLLISNQTQQEFTASLGPSLASRMKETGGVVECNWKGWR